MSDLRYPIGPFDYKGPATPAQRQACIEDIAKLPGRLGESVKGLDAEQLDTLYRPGGWTVRQVVHHVADSHINSYVRFRLAITEDEPTIKPYQEHLWAELPDARTADIAISLGLLEHLHDRWVRLLRSFQPADFARRFRHPEHDGPLDVDWLVQLYGWHCRHHVAHITELRRRESW
jgi:hypothetical protein